MSLPVKCEIISKNTTDEAFSNDETNEDEMLIEPATKIASFPVRKEETTVAKRLEILQKLEEGMTIDKVASEYGLHRRTIQRYRKNVESIKEFSKNPRTLAMKRNRLSVHEDINLLLHKWILKRQTKGDIFNDSLLQEKAKELHEKFGSSSSFTASRGWLWRFKKRYNLSRSSIHEEQANTDELSAEKLAKILSEENIDKNSIYNIQEKTLMWRSLPQTRLLHDEEPMQNERLKKDYVTVAFCANATGTHKLPPLFINKYASPQALKHCSHSLPVVYMSQNNGCIDEVIFNNWYINHFKPSVRQYQQEKHCTEQVLLLVDNFKGDLFFRKPQEDSYFKLMILPSDTCLFNEPMDESIIAKCNKLFRQKLLRRVLQYSGRIKEFYAHYDIKDCIDLVSEAWNEITMADIKHSWRKLLDQQNFETIIIKEEQEELEDNITSEEILEWISKCEKEELTIKEMVSRRETDIDYHCPIEKEEIDRMFHNLEVWSETQPDFIQLYAKVLICYHKQQ
ncbi:PREDICTED: jerky protein homolog-like [Habropoda laboriosa]|uniref:jerky protein homolog-like n=1 Tax=Habropoda laboriosa TaxID=597456 RepID=UPI00083CC99F|nr:PREDICTED: jerky protein homolog-like [Habropoda laboriosa]